MGGGAQFRSGRFTGVTDTLVVSKREVPLESATRATDSLLEKSLR